MTPKITSKENIYLLIDVRTIEVKLKAFSEFILYIKITVLIYGSI